MEGTVKPDIRQWIEDKNGINEYYVEIDKATHTHDVAKYACEKLGSVLASVKSKSTQSLLENLIPILPGNGTRQFWIGAYRTSENSSWVWDDGSQLNYTNWYPNEENQSSIVPENCASLISTFGYKWFSNHCESNYLGYVCERPVGGSPSTIQPLQNTSGINIIEHNFNNSTEEKNSDAILKVVLPILMTFLLLLFIIIALYSYKRKQGNLFCKWMPSSLTNIPIRQAPKRKVNEYVDLPTVSPNSSVEGTPIAGNSPNSEYMSIPNVHSNSSIETTLIASHSMISLHQEGISFEFDETKERAKSSIDNPTYGDLKTSRGHHSTITDTNDYMILHSIENPQPRHSSEPTLPYYQQCKSLSGEASLGAKKLCQTNQTNKSSNPQAEPVYVEVYSLSTKVKRKKRPAVSDDADVPTETLKPLSESKLSEETSPL